MQAMQQFDDPESGHSGAAPFDYDKYDEVDLDYFYCTKSKKKHSYETTLKQYYFPYQDALGNELELFTTVKCIYRITHGTFDPQEDSDWDYRGYMDLMSWEVLLVQNNNEIEVNPKDELTEDQLLEYTSGLSDYIGD